MRVNKSAPGPVKSGGSCIIFSPACDLLWRRDVRSSKHTQGRSGAAYVIPCTNAGRSIVDQHLVDFVMPCIAKKLLKSTQAG